MDTEVRMQRLDARGWTQWWDTKVGHAEVGRGRVGHRGLDTKVGCKVWTQRMDTVVGERGWMQSLNAEIG